MNESAVYTETDLKSFRNRLEELREIIRHDTESGLHPPAMTKLLDRKLNECGALILSDSTSPCVSPPAFKLIKLLTFYPDEILSDLQDSLSVLSVELLPIHQRLVTLRRQLVALAAKPKPFKADLKPIMEELRKIERYVTRFDLHKHTDGWFG